MAVKIFFCYAHEDEALLNKLKAHLKPLQRSELVDVWHDRDIDAGAEWRQEIENHLNTADIILLLVSPDFINSEFCYGTEMSKALQRHRRGEACVIPVILRSVMWDITPLGEIQALPTDAIPILSPNWHNPDEAFLDVAQGIRKIIKELNTSLPVTLKKSPETIIEAQKGEDAKLRKNQQAEVKRVGIFLDYDNIKMASKTMQPRELGKALRSFASQFGAVISCWVVATPQNAGDAGRLIRAFDEAGFRVRFPEREVSIERFKGSDVDFIMLECMNEESIRNNLNVYVLVTGDSDYYQRVMSLLQQGHTVHVVAPKTQMSVRYSKLQEARSTREHEKAGFFVDDLDEVLSLHRKAV